MITVHMVGNAHLDPAWLWNPCDGIDAALATARSACDLLDEFPSFVFTCSGSWFHEQVERHDPELFARVRAHVDGGRWSLVGGMVVQPDCNLPCGDSFARHFKQGQGYFRERFGRVARVGYNVDSFGHTAWLPAMLRAAGLDSYVFMRPMPEEMSLPSRVFRWRSPDGAEVPTFRIGRAYAYRPADLSDHIRAAIDSLPAGCDQTMCFYGVGDHGGGPTRSQIRWIAEHLEFAEGVRLEFSCPDRFFDAIRGLQPERLPVVDGELQHHAIGCYSVERRIKVGMRRAENRLIQAGVAMEALAAHQTPEMGPTLDQAWKAVLFNQFHDILGGTCLERASRMAAAEMTSAEGRAHDVLVGLTRRAMAGSAQPGKHQLVVFNPSRRPFEGLATHEPFMEFRAFTSLCLLDEEGDEIPTQDVEPASIVHGMRRIAFPLSVEAGGWRVLRIEEGAWSADEPWTEEMHRLQRLHPVARQPADQELTNAARALQTRGYLANIGGWRVSLDVHDDPTDTWSHEAGNAFRGALVGQFQPAGAPCVVENGPLRAAWRSELRHANSKAWCRFAVSTVDRFARVRIVVQWAETARLLRLRLHAPTQIDSRADLVSGGPLGRPLDGAEYPLNGGMLARTSAGCVTVAAPEVFSCGADRSSVWLTLLRSPFVAHHAPRIPEGRPDHPVTDLGWHEFDLVIETADDASVDRLGELADRMSFPLETFDLVGRSTSSNCAGGSSPALLRTPNDANQTHSEE
jgi:alpha-mannosidase